jgi:hypothetical protein
MGTYCADSFGLVAHPAYPSPLAERTLFRQTPEVGARCVNRARRDLCGGYSVRGIPTAIMGCPANLTGDESAFHVDKSNFPTERLLL